MTKIRRALVAAPLMPEFDREGGSQRVFNIIKLLRQSGWAVTFLAQNSLPGSKRYIRLLQQLGVAVYVGKHAVWAGDEYTPDTGELIAGGKFDLAILTFWFVGEEFLPQFRKLSPETCVLIDSIDLHFLRLAREKLSGRLVPSGDDPAAGQLDELYADEMRRELNTYAAADGVLCVSQKEADLINDMLARPGHACLVPLMEDLPVSPFSFEERKGILFIGNFRHPPNQEAIQYLCEQIMPEFDGELQAEHPLYIVGNDLNAAVRGFGEKLPNARLVGWVPALLPYLQKARLTVVPLLNGAGTKTKLIQTLMVGTPSVSTEVGIEGLNLHDRQEVLVADEPRQFARSMAELLSDKTLWERLSRQGRAHIEVSHSPAAVASYFWAAVEGFSSKIRSKV